VRLGRLRPAAHDLSEPVRVGLVGAGPWAGFVHAPALSGGPETALVGVWARRPEAAAELAHRHGASAFGSYAELLDACEAVAFAVPPAVQAELAPIAARAGKALLLEKPLAADVAGARRIADAVAEAGVPTLLVLTYRLQPRVGEYLREVRAVAPTGGRGWFISGGFLGGPFATPWRLERGAILDLGPHLLDLLDAALGRIVEVRAAGDVRRFVTLQLTHEGGAVSDLALSGDVPGPSRTGLEVFGPHGSLALDARDFDRDDGEIRRRFAAVARRAETTEIDAARGLHLQRLVAEAEASLR
jgi:predicted dehydrogenase